MSTPTSPAQPSPDAMELAERMTPPACGNPEHLHHIAESRKRVVIERARLIDAHSSALRREVEEARIELAATNLVLGELRDLKCAEISKTMNFEMSGENAALTAENERLRGYFAYLIGTQRCPVISRVDGTPRHAHVSCPGVSSSAFEHAIRKAHEKLASMAGAALDAARSAARKEEKT